VQAVRVRLGARVNRYISLTFKFGATLLVLAIVLGAVGMEFSTTPKFCTSCHYMQPFYDSWHQSPHKDVRCVDCHYAPGIRNELTKKFEALVQVSKYVTRQYGTRPVTQIEDASCLRSGCHEVRLLRGKVSFKGVQFDHLPHMTRFRRVTRLRCTSCHAHVMEGQHMSVSESTCFLCHFKQDATGSTTDLAECTRCHKQPLQTTKFDHTFVEQRNVSCLECHASVVQGQGEVPRERCVICHSEPERLKKYSDVAFMHENHVTQRKIECQQCHNTIQHTFNTNQEQSFIAHAKDGECGTCHDSKHDVVAMLYSGNGGIDVKGTPDPMYKAGVSCQACHRTYHKSDGVTFSAPGAAGCMMCHGEDYGARLTQWHAEFDGPVANTYTSISRARSALARQAKPDSEAMRLMNKAFRNIQFLKNADSVHNPNYARQILATAVTQANQALKASRLAQQVSLPPATANVATPECARCHFQPPAGTKTIFGTAFSHTRHVGGAGLQCMTCHRDNPPESADHGKLKLTQSDCRECHATRRIAKPHPTDWKQKHGQQALHNSQTCQTCHPTNQCATCHGGIQMPHAASWRTQHGPKSKQMMGTCLRCHQQTDCTTCHQTKRPHANDWIPQHGQQAMTSPAKCATCHQQTDCAVCHNSGGVKPAMHDQQWPKTHPKIGKQNQQLCEMCHAKKGKQDVCTTCHGGIQVPHTDDFIGGGHSKVASFDAAAPCFKCHTKKDTCSECHDG